MGFQALHAILSYLWQHNFIRRRHIPRLSHLTFACPGCTKVALTLIH